MGIANARIQCLPSLIANQIAAGEVIERPASVIKELLENALDAKANQISIDIGFGGLNQMKVSDNGQGIVADDLALAIAPHATSKICGLDDLYAVSSMGFRGEALASISSVSRIKISSKPAQQEHAMMLEFDSLSAARLFPCARAQGTTVEVLDLFFNAPVRKKFLKPPRSEFQAIETLVRRFALSAPHIALSLTHDAKLIFNLPAATSEDAYLDRRRKLLGKAFVDQAIFIEVEQAGMQLKAWLSDFSYQISQNDKQWVYVNQRMVKDKLLLHAVKQAYGDRLFPGRYPVCLLYFNLPQQDVDVNVHPTKHELRFQQPRLVHDFICSHLTQALASQGASMGSSLMDLGLSSPARTAMVQSLSVHRPSHGQLTPWSCLQGTADDEQPLRHELGSCLRLNALYALFFEHDNYFMVDIARAQTDMFCAQFADAVLPLAHRPLLLPFRSTFNAQEITWLLDYQADWVSLGMQIDSIADTVWAVRTIPLLFTQLDIKRVLQVFLQYAAKWQELSPLLRRKQLFSLLIECQSKDINHWSEEEKEGFIIHLRKKLQSSHHPIYCVPLNEASCTAFIKGCIDA